MNAYIPDRKCGRALSAPHLSIEKLGLLWYCDFYFLGETLKIDLFDDYARVDVDDDNITQIRSFILCISFQWFGEKVVHSARAQQTNKHSLTLHVPFSNDLFIFQFGLSHAMDSVDKWLAHKRNK